MPWTRSRAYRKNDNPHCEQKNWKHVRQLFSHDRFEHPELVALMNDLYAREWSQFTHHFKPTFKLLRREKRAGRTKRIYEAQPQTPYARLREEQAALNPFELKKAVERKLRNFFTALGNLDRESMKP